MTNSELESLMSKMRIPTHRKDRFNKVNLTWLSKNLGIFNSEHKNYEKVLREVNRRIENKEYEN